MMKVAVFGSSYAACFKRANKPKSMDVHIFAGQGHSLCENLEIDSDGVMSISQAARKWDKRIWERCVEGGDEPNINNYDYFVISIDQPCDTHKLFTPPLCQRPLDFYSTLSQSLVTTIVGGLLSVHTKTICGMLGARGVGADRIRFIPNPNIGEHYVVTNIQKERMSRTEKVEIIEHLYAKVERAFADNFDLNMISPPADIFNDDLSIPEKYCRNSQGLDTTWKEIVAKNSVSSDYVDEYHKNTLYGELFLKRIYSDLEPAHALRAANVLGACA